MSLEISEKLRKALQRLGLTEYEIRAYMALLERGDSTANEVSRVGVIPMSKVYDALSSLERKGWLIIEKGRPARYRAQPPSVVAGLLKAKLESEIDEITSMVVSELNPLYEKRADREKPDLWIIRGEENLWRSVKEVIGRAKRHLSIAIPYIPRDLQRIMLPIVSIMRERGGTVQILVGEGCNVQSIRKLLDVSEVRLREISFGGGVISDSSEVVLLLMGRGDKVPKLGIYSAHVGLTTLAQSYFDLLWTTSSPIKSRQSS